MQRKWHALHCYIPAVKNLWHGKGLRAMIICTDKKYYVLTQIPWMNIKIRKAQTANWLTNSMEHSHSWEANSSLPRQEILCISREPRVCYCARKTTPLVPILSHTNPFQTYPFKIHIMIVLPSIPNSCKWSLSPKVSPPKPCTQSPLPHHSHTRCPSPS